MPAVAPMTTVTKHVQQGAGEDEEEGQNAQYVSPVLGEEQRSPHRKEGEEDKSTARGPEAAPWVLLVVCVLVVYHLILLVISSCALMGP